MHSEDSTPRINGKTGLTQAQRTARTRTLLLRAALDLIAEGGFQNASLANIGKRAGYSRGVVTHTFGSKAKLLAELVERMAEHFNHRNLAPAVGDARGAPALCIALDEMLKVAWQSPVDTRAFYCLLFEALGSLPELREPLAGVDREMRSNIADSVQRGIDAGEVNPEFDPMTQAGLFIGSVRGMLYQWLLDDSYDLKRAGEEYKKTIMMAYAIR